MQAVAARHNEMPPQTTAAIIRRALLKDVSRHVPLCSTCKLSTMCLSMDLEARLSSSSTSWSRRGFDCARAIRCIELAANSPRFIAFARDRVRRYFWQKIGQGQIAGYHMAGEVIGIDGIGDERHECEAVALEDTEVCVLPLTQLTRIARDDHVSSAICIGCCLRDRPRAAIDAVARDAARGPARRRFPSRSVTTLSVARLFRIGIRAAHDARGNRQLPRAQAGDGQPVVIAISTRRAHSGGRPRNQAARSHHADGRFSIKRRKGFVLARAFRCEVMGRSQMARVGQAGRENSVVMH